MNLKFLETFLWAARLKIFNLACIVPVNATWKPNCQQRFAEVE